MGTGADQFRNWIERRGFTQRETADYFGWDETFITKLVRGVRVPGLANAIAIERATGIPVEAWVPSERDTASTLVGVGRSKSKPDKK